VQGPDLGPDFVGITIERCYQAKTELIESAVSAQGATQVPYSHQDHIPGAIGSEYMLNGRDQILHTVSNSPLADLP